VSTNTYPTLFASTFLTDSNAGIWTMPGTAATTTILQDLTLMVSNKTNAVRLVNIYAFSSGSASSTNALILTHPIPAYDYILIPVPRIEGSSAAIQGYCDVTNSVTVAPVGGKLHVP
jgi:hypothetical protein